MDSWPPAGPQRLRSVAWRSHPIDRGHWIESLRDGAKVLIRPLGPEDREREENFIKRLSPDARRLRFLGTFKQANPALIDQLMDVDYQQQMAFVALAHDGGQLREVGVSRYSEAGNDKRCVCAVAVADEWQPCEWQP